MALRVIAEAGIRLRADGKGLALEIRTVISRALREAQAASRDSDIPSPTTRMADDADRDSNRMRKSLSGLLKHVGSVASGLASALLAGTRLALIGTAAVGALAGVTQLALGVGALAGAAAQAAGVLGLLPAALAALAVVQVSVKLATQGMGDAFKAIASGDAAAFNEALKELSPSARQFAQEMKALKPIFDEIQQATQEALFSEIADVVKPLGQTYLPIFGAAFQGVAKNIGLAARETADFLLQAPEVQKVTVFTTNVQEAFANLAGAMRPATSALVDLVSTGSTFLPRLTAAVSTFATGFAEKISAMAADGRLEAFFERAIVALQTLGRIFGNVFESLGNVMNAARTAGAGLLESIEAITQRLADFTGSNAGQEALVSFFASMHKVVQALLPVLEAVFSVFANTVLPILAQVASVIGPVLVPIIAAFGRLLSALSPLFQALAGALGQVLAAFEPVIDAFSEAINDAMPTLGPIIKEIGAAFANLVKSMAPLAGVFVQLLQALLPIVPPLIQMVADLMPRLIDFIIAIVPYIQAWADMMVTLIPIFTDIVGFLLDVFIPVFSIIATVLGFVLTVATAVIQGIWNVVTSVFGAIADFISYIWNGIGDFFSGIFSWIGDLFSDGFGGLVGKVGQWFTQIWQNIVSLMGNIVSGVGDAIGNVVDWFLSLPGKVWDAVKGAARWLYDTGRQIIQGLIDGIKSMVDDLLSVIGVTTQGAINKAKSGFAVKSPSRVFHQIGVNVGQGLVDGLHSMVGDVAAAADAMVAGALPDDGGITLDANHAGELVGAGAGVGRGAVVVNQTNVMRPGTDVNQFANIVLRRGYGDFLSGANTLTVGRNGVQAGVNDQQVNA